MKFLAKGKRGKVYLTGEKTIIKKADGNRVRNEVYWLKKLNDKRVGPKLIDYGKDWFEMEYIRGELMKDYLGRCSRKEAMAVLKDCLKQCRVMDLLKVNKKEMHHPDKHIIIRKGEAVFIDFERCKLTENPKNVTQFCQYILKLSGMFPRKIKVGKEKMVEVMKYYKKEQSEKNFKKNLRLI